MKQKKRLNFFFKDILEELELSEAKLKLLRIQSVQKKKKLHSIAKFLLI